MPKVEAGETRDNYMSRCMVSAETAHFPEDQRKAVCEHLFDREAKAEVKEQAEPALAEVCEDAGPLVADKAFEPGLIKNVRIMGLESRDVEGNLRRTYTEECVREAVPMFNGAKVFVDHGDSRRKAAERLGTMENPRYDAVEKAVRGDLRYLPSHPMAKALEDDVHSGKTRCFALSHRSRVMSRMEKGVERVNKIDFVRSVDLVTGGAMNRSVTEQAESADDIDSVRELAEQVQELSAQQKTMSAQLELAKKYMAVPPTSAAPKEIVEQATATPEERKAALAQKYQTDWKK